MAKQLSKQVSAFANTEGGVIVIGIREKKVGKSRIAQMLDDGISREMWSPERLQQIIESNIHPPQTGIRVHQIPVTNDTSRFHLIIWVPKGTTAYQAKDHLYYGRSEYENKPLRDHEIRLRMFRGREPDATIAISNLIVHSTNGSREGSGNAPIIIEGRNYSFNFVLKNSGEVNITQFKIKYRFSSAEFDERKEVILQFRDGVPEKPVLAYHNSEWRLMKINIYPGDDFTIQSYNRDFDSETDFLQKNIQIDWTLYLPNRLPVNGVINLATLFESIPIQKEN